MEDRVCLKCGIKKKLDDFHKNQKWRKRVCRECWNAKYRTGKENTGRFKKGNIPWIKGKKLSAKIIIKKDLELKRFGKGRNSWRAEQWKKEILERDNHTCQNCGTKEKLHCHHIIPWKENEELRFEVSNGIVYCNSCHYKIENTGKPAWNKNGFLTEEHKKKLRGARPHVIPWNRGKITIQKSKVCKICGIEKVINEFTPEQKWHSNKCKTCRNKMLKERRLNVV